MADKSRQPATADEQLVLAALQGDVSSFGTLVERYWRLVFALVLTRIHNPAEAEDIAQESFLKAYAHLRSLRRPARFAGWLSKIASQQCANAARAHLRHKAALIREAAEPAHGEALPAYSSNPGLTDVQARFVRQTVGKLPETLQTLVLLRFMTGLSAVQIAEQLGKRPGTIRVYLHRAYKMLRQDLAPLLEEVEL
jgi:RNA polymerase sigma-70 factor (ECF subfamily)